MVSTIVRHNTRLLFSPSGYFCLTRADSNNYYHLYVSRTVRQCTVHTCREASSFQDIDF